MPVSQLFVADTPRSATSRPRPCEKIETPTRKDLLRQGHKFTFAERNWLVFLRIDDVERRLNVSRSSVYRLIRAGELDVVHIGAAIRISEESLDSFVTTHTTFGTAVAR